MKFGVNKKGIIIYRRLRMDFRRYQYLTHRYRHMVKRYPLLVIQDRGSDHRFLTFLQFGL